MKKLLPLWIVIAACFPSFVLYATGHPTPPLTAVLTGFAILSASFMLLWACDVAQNDIPQALALAVVALIAVMPEYAVDMYFTWMAGKYPESSYSHYAIANMTGANRLLIGVGWAVIVFVSWWKTRTSVILEKERRTEVIFLGLATAYSLLIPLKGSLTWMDGIVLVGLYVVYIGIASRRPCEECELDGPAAVLGALPTPKRRLATAGLFLFAALTILLNAEPFSESLVATGRVLQINEFLLVQWLAPIASEAPEFIVAIMFALRGMGSVALASLLSAKLNQWTLLVGMIPAVFGLAAGQYSTPIPLDNFQLHELMLTAAQSLFAVALLADLKLTPRGAVMLLALFLGQFLAPAIPAGLLDRLPIHATGQQIHFLFTFVYFAGCAALVLFHSRVLMRFMYRPAQGVQTTFHDK